jgi:hypothetical protein
MAEQRQTQPPSPSGRVWRQLEATPRAALEQDLTQADLQTLLLGITRQRAAGVTPATLMRRWREDRYVTPAGSDPRKVWQLEARLWALLPGEFTAIDLSPTTPLGTCTAVAPGSQDRVISTTRGTEVVSDPTNVLALEAAQRRHQARQDARHQARHKADTAATEPVHLACCHRVLRAQPFNAPGFFQHFRLFALVSSDRDQGSAATEARMLTAHLAFWIRALSELAPARRTVIRYTVFGFPPLAERIRDAVLPGLQPLPPSVAIDEDPDRQHARGYYERGAIKIHVDGQEIGDGGFTNWTAQFGNDAKERCFTSCVSTERLTELAAPAP